MGSPVHYRHYAYDAGHLRSSRARLSNLNLNSTLLTSRELLDHFYLGAFLVLLVCVTFNPVPQRTFYSLFTTFNMNVMTDWTKDF